MAAPTPPDRWSRLTSMDRDELIDRLRQKLAARVDGLRYHLNLGFDTQAHNGVEATPRFFFAAGQADSVCALLKQRLPGQAAEIIRQAQRIREHRFDLLGYEGVQYGAEVDWHLDPIHNKRAPQKPWYQVPYLDFDVVGDSKIIWELNRHQHLVTLAKAYRLSGDPEFSAELFLQWYQWHEHNPYPVGINWASSLEVAFRSLSWIWIYFLLEGVSGIPASFHTQWVQAMGLSGRHIERYLSTYFSPNTHLLGEGVALFFIGTLCPELHSAARWKQRGWEIVLREAQRQVQADGLHFEQSTYYHVYALDLFLHAAVLASINDVPVPKELDRTLEKMLDALAVLSRADAPPRFGDDDGGRLFDPRRNRAEHMIDPLATGAVLLGRGDFKVLAGGLREETLWLLGESGAAEFDRLPAKPAPTDSVALTAGGLYIMSSPHRTQLVIDAGPQGAATAGHGHADALSIVLTADGRELLIDPGTCEYVGPGKARDRYRSTRAHNTLVVDDTDQADPNGPFAWANLPNVTVENWTVGENFDLFVGSHDGYSRLASPVIHRRWVFGLKSQFWFVRDQALGDGEHQLDLYWHQAFADGKNTDVLRQSVPMTLLHANMNSGQPKIGVGEWSPVYGQNLLAPVVHLSAKAALPAEFGTLLLPVATSSVAPGKLTSTQSERVEGAVRGYCHETRSASHFMFFSDGKKWTTGPWTSDAEFLYWGRSEENNQRTLIVCNATSVKLEGTTLFSSAARAQRCEIVQSGENTQVFCSDKTATVAGDLPQQTPEFAGAAKTRAGKAR